VCANSLAKDIFSARFSIRIVIVHSVCLSLFRSWRWNAAKRYVIGCETAESVLQRPLLLAMHGRRRIKSQGLDLKLKWANRIRIGCQRFIYWDTILGLHRSTVYSRSLELLKKGQVAVFQRFLTKFLIQGGADACDWQVSAQPGNVQPLGWGSLVFVSEPCVMSLLPCTICQNAYASQKALRRHIKEKHSSNERESFDCPFCSNTHSLKRTLSNHIKDNHSEQRMTPPYLLDPFHSSVCFDASIPIHSPNGLYRAHSEGVFRTRKYSWFERATNEWHSREQPGWAFL